MRILIIGCGYLGLALGRKLMIEGHSVIGVTRSGDSTPAIAKLGIEPRSADCSTVEGAQLACRGGAEIVVSCVSSRGGDYQNTYVKGMQCVLHALEGQSPRFFLHASSTSVYAQTTGEWVTEKSPAEPIHENGRLLLETERVLANAARNRFAACSFRISGIYGPMRHALLDQLGRGVKTLPGDGAHWMNQIHRDDIVQAFHCLIKSGPRMDLETWNSEFGILNLSDDTPVLQRDYVEWCCEKIGRVPPVFKTGETESGTRGRKGFQSNRRICNQALKSLGWTLAYPSYREGIACLLTGC